MFILKIHIKCKSMDRWRKAVNKKFQMRRINKMKDVKFGKKTILLNDKSVVFGRAFNVN